MRMLWYISMRIKLRLMIIYTKLLNINTYLSISPYLLCDVADLTFDE